MSIKKNNFSNNTFFMNLALMQAYKVLGNTGQNPAVGCVVVKDKNVISSTHTGIKGRPHAEILAIKFAKKNIYGSELFVTLEPCSHYGLTPPCVKSIIKNKVKKVFFSIYDPDLRSFKKSSKNLKKEKISVKTGTCSNKINYFYRSYYKFKKEKLPFVTAKVAASKDLFTKSKKKRWITNRFSRGRVHLIRSQHDCIITSAKTIIDDNSKLTCRIAGLENFSPTRIILDKKLKIPIDSNMAKSAKKNRTLIFFNTGDRMKIKVLRSLKVKLYKFPLSKEGNFDLKSILIKIKQFGYSRILIESGLTMTTNFLKNNLVDDLQLFISNNNLGNLGNNSMKKNVKLFLSKKKYTNEVVNLMGDKLISYKIK